MFEDFFSPVQRFGDTGIMPAIDIKEDEKYLTVTAELPGVERKDVQISVHDNVLTLKGEKHSEKKEEKGDYHFVERKFGSFSRSVLLPSEVDSDHAEATMKDGVLTLRLPTKRGPGAKTINIK
ncbi:Small heat shock protein [Enhygromyxa salina]|uniref:Small heat shock protein n=2 Tax=Enhygromyxa salina TaxID=215803 RepID=A0A0C1ZSJ4_9BACT|nr:Small heat shock protein [Enhygromyxa salina]